MKRITIIFAALAFVLMSGCTQSLENTYSNQETRIDSFLKSLQKNIIDQAEKLKPEEGAEDYNEKYAIYMEYLALLDAGMGQIAYNRNSNRITLIPGIGQSLPSTGKVSIYYGLYTFNGSVSANNLVFTNSKDIADESKWEVTDPSFEPVTVDLQDKNTIEGLRNGLEGVKQGEECYIVFSGKYGYGNKVQGTIPANSALLYHIKVVNIL